MSQTKKASERDVHITISFAVGLGREQLLGTLASLDTKGRPIVTSSLFQDKSTLVDITFYIPIWDFRSSSL